MNTPVDFMEPGESDQDDLLQLLTLLWAKRIWIALAATVFALAGLMVAKILVPQFQAEALVQLETKSNGVQLSQDIAEMLSSESEAVTEIAILKSRMVLGSVVEKLSLDIVAAPKRLPVIGNYLSREQWPRPALESLQGYAWHGESIKVERLAVPDSLLGVALSLVKISASDYQINIGEDIVTGRVGQTLVDDSTGVELHLSELEGVIGTQFHVSKIRSLDAISRVRKDLDISEAPRNSGIMRIAKTSASAELSEKIVSEVVNAYIRQNVGRSAAEAEKSLQFLNDQIPKVQAQLSTAESVLNAYRLESSSIDLNLEAQSILEQSVSIDSQISKLSLEETELSRRYTQNHPTYRALLEKKQRLQAEKQLLGASVKSLPATQQEILSLTRDVDVSQQIYIQLMNKSQELNVMKAGAVGNVRLIDDAAAYHSPVSPKIPLITALAALLGSALSVGVILLRHNMSREIDTPEDLKGLRPPVLAVIPFSRYQFSSSRQRKFPLLSREHSNEISVEAIRGLRTSLHFSLQDRERNIVCVTSPSPSVGKSFISTNLAYLVAQSGAKVLVIDGDMRRGGLGMNFKLPRNLPGLAQLLAGTHPASLLMKKVDIATLKPANKASAKRQRADVRRKRKLVADIDSEYEADNEYDATVALYPSFDSAKPVQETDQKYITVLPRGQAADNPSELLMDSRLPTFLEWASQNFDMVVIDTPPILAVTDAVIISKYSDIKLMIVRQGETTTHEAEEVVNILSNNKVSVTGFVLNGYDTQKSRYGKYGAHYGYRYTY